MKIKYPEIAAAIMAMVKIDQKVRFKNNKDGKVWNRQIDIRNTKNLAKVIRSIGWPTRSKVGKRASHGAWLLAQHADLDRHFQHLCFLSMKSEKPPEVERRDVAHLEDRVRRGFGLRQTYGTEFTQIDGKHVPLPIEDSANVSRRRKTMGLDTLRQNIARMYKKFPIKK